MNEDARKKTLAMVNEVDLVNECADKIRGTMMNGKV